MTIMHVSMGNDDNPSYVITLSLQTFLVVKISNLFGVTMGTHLTLRNCIDAVAASFTNHLCFLLRLTILCTSFSSY